MQRQCQHSIFLPKEDLCGKNSTVKRIRVMNTNEDEDKVLVTGLSLA